MSDVTREFVIEVTQGAYIEDIGYALRYGERREEIVRCRDCKDSDPIMPEGGGKSGLVWCDATNTAWSTDDFCSWGERREDA